MISVHDLTKRFEAGDDTIVAVDRLSFRVEPGEVFGLLGPNGAGKTTTLRMIVGLLQPDDGNAEVAGYRTGDAPDAVKSQIGCVTSSHGIYPWLTVRETLLFFADLYEVPPSEAAESVKRLTKTFRMEDIIDRRSYVLSSGQKQRAILARALVHDPPVMLLDEPTRGLDVIGSQTVFEYMQHLRSEGKAVILSTHRLDEAERLCDRFGLMHEGRLHHEGTMDELRSSTGCQSLVEIFHDLTSGDGPTLAVHQAD